MSYPGGTLQGYTYKDHFIYSYIPVVNPDN